jgi:alpha-glucoside transport system substrate-binding protein
MRRRQAGPRELGALALVLVSLAASIHCASSGSETVTVLASWTGAEQDDFGKILKSFTAKTGIQVDFEGTRALNEVLLSSVKRGAAPDVAVSSPGQLARYQRDGDLYPVNDALGKEIADYLKPSLLPLPSAGSKMVYAVPVKANLKTIVWFDPANLPGINVSNPPGTWAALGAAAAGRGPAPWCMGLGDPPNSGWPGADWIQDVILRQSGVGTYQEWAAGRLPWTSAAVRNAWVFLGDLVTRSVHGGAGAARFSDFKAPGTAMFKSPPGCFLEHQGSFQMGFYESAQLPPGAARAKDGHPQPGVDFDFFPFPSFGGADTHQVVQPDLAAMFRNTDAARQLVHFLASREGQSVWPGIPGQGGFSMDRQVGDAAYKDRVSVRIAKRLSAGGLCFDARGVMPPVMGDAFDRAVLEYVSDTGQLDSILQKLDAVRGALQKEPWPSVLCT